MQRRITLFAFAALATTAACGDFMSANNRNFAQRADLATAFNTVPLAYTTAQTTYSTSSEASGPMFPGAPDGGMGHHPHDGMGGGMGPMIGGGLGPDFLGGPGLGHDFGRGPHGDPDVGNSNATCTYSASTGRAACTPVTHDGITITRSVAWYDASGKVQSAFDSTATNTINTQVTVTGTMTRRDSAVSTINNSSNRTIGGLAKGSTKRTVDGTAAGKEVTTGKDTAGTFTATRTAADTVKGVVIPVATSDTARTYPTAGTIIRAMTVSVARSSGTTSSTHREVITYDGSATAKMVITQDGTTKTCTLPLPMGKPTCQ